MNVRPDCAQADTGDRSHCTCTEVVNIRFEQAAEKLGCKVRFLLDNKHRIIHQRFGAKRVMCPCELRLAQRLFTINPERGEGVARAAAENAPPAVESSAIARIHQIRPAGAAKRSRTG